MQHSPAYLHNAAMLLLNSCWIRPSVVPSHKHCCLGLQGCGLSLWQLTALFSLLTAKVTTLAEWPRKSALCA